VAKLLHGNSVNFVWRERKAVVSWCRPPDRCRPMWSLGPGRRDCAAAL